MRYQRHVGGRHLVIAQTVWSDPGEFLSFLRGHGAVPAPAHVERHEQMKVGVSMARKGERCDARLRDRNPQFLSEFADERLFGPFTRFHLTARELPQSGHRASGRTLCKQNASISIDQRACGDQNELHAATPVGWVERQRNPSRAFPRRDRWWFRGVYHRAGQRPDPVAQPTLRVTPLARLSRSRPVITINRDILLGEIAGEDAVAAAPDAEPDLKLD